MPRSAAALIAALLALASDGTVVALDRSIAQADNAWLIVVDDLHINFANTGRLRSLLRTAASELVRDGDLVELRPTGPSGAVPLTADRELLAAGIKMATGNSLKPEDFIGTGLASWNEVLYRANTSLETARDALTAFSLGDGRRKAIVFVSAGYDIEAFPALAARVGAFAQRAREDNIPIFAIDARGFSSAAPLDPPVDASAWLRYTTAARRSLAMMADETGGFVIEDGNDPAAALKRINLMMR
jgi:hypothetical protein